MKLVKKLQKAKDDENTRNLAERLYETLCAQRAFEIDKHPEMLVLEHRRNLRLRPSQVEHLESLISSQSDEIHEIIMGSGKSDILIPLFAIF